jgi:hypothetical protein
LVKGRERASEILILGNGPSATSGEWGPWADRFPVVGRINNYSTAGYEAQLGCRTDIWFNGANQGLERRREFAPRVVVLVPSEVLRHKGQAMAARVRRRLHLPAERFELVPSEEIEALEARVGEKRVTTGTMAILWAERRYPRVVIHGFDFFQGSRAHYNDSAWRRWWVDRGHSRRGRRHDTLAEKRVVEELIAEGRVVRLPRWVAECTGDSPPLSLY